MAAAVKVAGADAKVAPGTKAVEEYASEPLVVERLETVYRYAADGTGSREITAVTRIQADSAARDYGVLSVPFAGSDERVQILYLRVRHGDGTVVETPATDMMEMLQAVTQAAPFYRDLKMAQIPVRSLRAGDRLEYQVKVVRTRAEAKEDGRVGAIFGQRSFATGVVVLDERLELHFPLALDKHTLLAALLTTEGFRPSAVLIGAGIRIDEEVPSPASFNHLITQMGVKNKAGAEERVWLDTTAEVAPYRMLLAPLRDKRALVIPDADVARVERTPVGLPFAPFEAKGTLDKDGTTRSHMVYTSRGDDEVQMRAVLRTVPPGKWNEFVQQLSIGIGFGRRRVMRR